MNSRNNMGCFIEKQRSRIQAIFLFLIFFPLFFQLQGTIFKSTAYIYESLGQLTRLPLPIAVIFCFSGLALLIRPEKVRISAEFLFSFFVLMVLSTFSISGEGEPYAIGKFILLAQIVLPVFALLLGQSYIKNDKRGLGFEEVFLYVLVLIIPSVVFATLWSDRKVLYPQLMFFSLYQHLQYLPVIFTGVFYLSAIAVRNSNVLRIMVIGLSPFIGIYTAASVSILCVFLNITGSIMFVVLMLREGKRIYGLLVFILSLGFMIGYGFSLSSSEEAQEKFAWIGAISPHSIQSFKKELHKDALIQRNNVDKKKNNGRELDAASIQGDNPAKFETTRSMTDRYKQWSEYIEGITESRQTFLFGHSIRPDRARSSSAHNYYLDIWYNFGLIAIVPVVLLIAYTLFLFFSCRRQKTLSIDDFSLAALVFFLILIDNSFKVGLRQPYPGIITFFLWGVLLSRLLSGRKA